MAVWSCGRESRGHTLRRGKRGTGGQELAVEFGAEDLAQAHAVVERYADQPIGLADASIAILAARYQTRTVVTLDRRHFGFIWPIDGGSFEILPYREPRTRSASRMASPIDARRQVPAVRSGRYRGAAARSAR